MSEQPLVSIVTPTLNRATLLESTLRSIRGQTYPVIEHIVMDGGSTDGTVDLLHGYEGTYDLRWQSAVDAGMYPAINAGLRLTRGEIVAYLNSDDVYFPWTIEVVVEAFKRHAEADFVFGDALAIDDETGQQSLYWMLPFNLDFVRRTGFIVQPTVFWRRRVFEEDGGFDESLRYVADCDYWMRTGAHRRFVKIPEFLAVERNHPATLRKAVGKALMDELEVVRSRYVSLVGATHTRRLKAHERRSYAWWRVYSLGLLIQSLVPRQVRRGPWSHLLNSGSVRLKRLRLLVRALPFIKRVGRINDFAAGDVLHHSRLLLEPP
jgi:glycosyltransferase involved in cell wall biosynthesis